MPAKKKVTKAPGAGMTAKQKKRRKPIGQELMFPIEPITDNQKIFFEEWDKGQMLYAYGVAGTGKTFIALYKALCDVLGDNTPYEKIYVVRSLVPSREIGFLPGDADDKSFLYQVPYKKMVQSMFQMPDDNAYEMLYENLKSQDTISFWSTSFIRGTTFDNAIIIIDECQNLNFHELDSIITRVGQDSRIVFCGDQAQTDLVKINERTGILDFQKIIGSMDEFSLVEFGIEDIVRSGLVKSYLISKINAGL